MPPKYSGARGGDRLWPKVSVTDTCWTWTGSTDRDGYGKLRTFEQRSVRAHVYAWWLATGQWPDGDELVAHTCDIGLPPGDTSYRACVRNDEVGTYTIDGVQYERRGHLWLGTHAANIRDRDLKGRAACGDRSGPRLHPDAMARGDRNGARLHPDRLARGDQNPSRLHPERLARGDRNGSRLHPESRPKGESHARARLTEAIVLEIRSRRSHGATTRTLAQDYAVSIGTIENVIYRRHWRHI